MLLSTCRQKQSKMIWNWHEIIQFVCRYYEQLKVFERREKRQDNSNLMTTTLVSVRIDSLTCITSYWKEIAYFPNATTRTKVKNRVDINLLISVLLPIWRSSLKNRRHLTTLQLVSPRNDVWVTSAEIPYWWRHYPDLGSAFHWSWRKRNLFHLIRRRTTQIWVVNVISMMEFRKSLLSDVISWWGWKYRLFFHAT